MQTGKTLGPDGFPVEFYKIYMEEITPRLQTVFASALKTGTLPASMSEAVIVLIPKPGKDPTLCASYRPISLLNVDAKVLAKILAIRLNKVITALTHPDQTGFMPGRGTDINIRRLHIHIEVADLGWWPHSTQRKLSTQSSGATCGGSFPDLALARSSSHGFRCCMHNLGLAYARVVLCRSPFSWREGLGRDVPYARHYLPWPWSP